MVRKSLMANACFPRTMPLPEQFELAAAAGFAGIEIGLAREGFFSFDGPAADVATVAALATRTIPISGMLAGPMWQVSPTDNDPSVREQAQALVRRSVEVAGDLGVDALLLVPGTCTADIPYAVAWERAQSFIRNLLPHCERHGVTLAVENVWNKMLYSPMEMKLFLEQIGSPDAACYFDAGNCVAFGWPQHWISCLDQHIKRVHVKGFRSQAGYTHAGFVRLLEGDVDWPAVMAALRAIGYDDWITAEIGPYELDSRKHVFDLSTDMDVLLRL